MSAELHQLISLWGGIASIAALLLSALGGIIVIIKKMRRRQKEEIDKIEAIQNRVAERTKAATTQGKRMDLFIYYQSLFSSLHASQIKDEIERYFWHIFSLISFLFFIQLDANSDYYIDRLFGDQSFLYNNYGLWLLVISILLAALNMLLLIDSKNHRKRIDAMTSGLIEELQRIVDV